jgi:hypothetical protein
MDISNIVSWQAITIVFSILGIVFAALIYQLSKIFGISEAEKFVKGELLEAGLNIVLALALLAIIIPYLNYVSVFYAKMVFDYKNIGFDDEFKNRIDQCTSPFSCSGITVSELVIKMLYSKNIRGCLERYTQSMMFLYSLSADYAYGIQGSNVEPTGAPTDAWNTMFQNLYQQALNAYILLIFSVKALAFMNSFGPALIALGIPLRAFAPTRSAGAFLISMGLGFMLVFPISYIFMIGNFYQEGEQLCKVSGEIDSISGLDNVNKWARGGAEISFIPNFLMSAANFLHVIAYAVGGYTGLFIAGITRTYTTMCIIPLTAFAITMTFINVNTSILGGRISEIGRGLFRLI